MVRMGPKILSPGFHIRGNIFCEFFYASEFFLTPEKFHKGQAELFPVNLPAEIEDMNLYGKAAAVEGGANPDIRYRGPWFSGNLHSG